jgi:hypothetical protein
MIVLMLVASTHFSKPCPAIAIQVHFMLALACCPDRWPVTADQLHWPGLTTAPIVSMQCPPSLITKLGRSMVDIEGGCC